MEYVRAAKDWLSKLKKENSDAEICESILCVCNSNACLWLYTEDLGISLKPWYPDHGDSDNLLAP